MTTQVRYPTLIQLPLCRFMRYKVYMGGAGMVYYDPNIYTLDTLPSVSYLGIEYEAEEYTQIGCAFGFPVGDDHSPSKQSQLMEDLDGAEEQAV